MAADARRRRRCRIVAPIAVRAGQTLALGAVDGAGPRAYLAVRGGFDVPRYLGLARDLHARRASAATPTGALRAGDVLHIGDAARALRRRRVADADELPPLTPRLGASACSTARTARPTSSRDDDIETLFAADWEVHYNSRAHRRAPDRPEAAVGARATAARPACIRPTSTTTPTPSARSTSPATCRSSSGPTARASAASSARPSWRATSCGSSASSSPATPCASCRSPTRRRCRSRAGSRTVITRAGADARLGDRRPRIDDERRPRWSTAAPATTTCWSSTARWCSTSTLRLRVHALMQAVAGAALPGHRRPHARHPLAAGALRQPSAVARAAARRCSRESERDAAAGRRHRRCRRRIVHLPLSWDDPADAAGDAQVQELGAAGRALVPEQHRVHPPHQRPRRSRTTCKRIVFDASYLVLGLGDVYLGAPVATPLDPRHRLVTTKYNPARTWTPENAVGIGGAYLCIYGMEGPGGYQFVGRTVQMWNRWRTTPEFRRRQALAAALLRPDPLLPGQRRTNCWRRARRSRTAPIRCKIEETAFCLRRLRRIPRAQRGRRSPRSRRRSRRRSRPSASAGGSCGLDQRRRRCGRRATGRSEAISRRATSAYAPQCRATSGRSLVEEGDQVESRADAGGHRVDEDGDRHRRDRWRGVVAHLLRRAGPDAARRRSGLRRWRHSVMAAVSLDAGRRCARAMPRRRRSRRT